MKNKKTVLGAVIVILLLVIIGGIYYSRSSGHKADSPEAANELYEKVLADQDASFKLEDETFTMKDFQYYAQFDINGDGVMEMLLTAEEGPRIYESTSLLLTCVKGAIVPVASFSTMSGQAFYANNDRFIQFDRSSGEEHLIVYTMGGDCKLQPEESFDYYQPYHYSEMNNASDLYMHNDKEIGEDEFKELWDKYTSQDMTYTKIR